MPNFAYYAVVTAYSPAKAMKRLLGETRPFRVAAEAVGVVGLLYAATSVVLAVAGAVPLATGLVRIPPENYYFWQMFFVIPCVLLAWVLVSGLIHILGKHERNRPAFEKTASLAGIALAASLFLAWIPMALVAFFLAVGMSQQELVGMLSEPGMPQASYIALYILAAAAAAACLSLAAGRGHLKKSGRARVVVIGVLAAAVLAGTFMLFIR